VNRNQERSLTVNQNFYQKLKIYRVLFLREYKKLGTEEKNSRTFLDDIALVSE
jgi:hypothetical protein